MLNQSNYRITNNRKNNPSNPFESETIKMKKPGAVRCGAAMKLRLGAMVDGGRRPVALGFHSEG